MKIFLGITAKHLNLKKDQFRKLKVGLGNAGIEYRMEPVEDLHITLASFGDVESKDYEDKEVYIKNIIQSHFSFELKLQGLSAFPDLKEGRLLWIGVQNKKELRALQADLAQQISSVCNLDYKPILPIARLRNYKNLTDIVSPYKSTDFGKLIVETVNLYEMISGGAFPVFKVLKTYYLTPAIEEAFLVEA